MTHSFSRAKWLALLLLLMPGCAGALSHLAASSRLDKGYTLILPGILGRNFWDENIARGLEQANVQSAIEIHDWTQGPHMIVSNVLGRSRNQREVAAVARKIVHYQNQYPGRPVYLIGHSGGANMVVNILESLPEEHRINGAVLLAAGVPRSYDLRTAQKRTVRGIHNFYSPLDIVIGQGVSSLQSLRMRENILTAAFVGFRPPRGLSNAERLDYDRALVQHPFTLDMLTEHHAGGHFGWTSPTFVQNRIAPILLETQENKSENPLGNTSRHTHVATFASLPPQ